MTLAIDKYAAAAGSFCFLKPENGEQKDASNLIAMSCVQHCISMMRPTKKKKSISPRSPRVQQTIC